MGMLIYRREYERDPDGKPIHYRTKYYKWFSDCRPALGAKRDAVRMDESTAAVVKSQLEQLCGEGWMVGDENEAPK